mgnify:CR=1 FL=1
MSSSICHLESLQKSNSKMNKKLQGSVYEKCRGTRPYILKVLRLYDNLEKEIAWSDFIRVLYVKSIKDFIPVLNKEIPRYKRSIKWYGGKNNKLRLNYLINFKNNLLNIKKKCENSTIMYYNYLPGNKLPLEVRSKIISFISPVPME